MGGMYLVEELQSQVGQSKSGSLGMGALYVIVLLGWMRVIGRWSMTETPVAEELFMKEHE